MIRTIPRRFLRPAAGLLAAGALAWLALGPLARNRWMKAALGERGERFNVLALAPDGRSVAAGGWHHDERRPLLRVWALGDSAAEWNAPRPADVRAVAYSPDGALLAGAGDGWIRLWSPDHAEKGRIRPPYPVTSLAFSRDGRSLVSGGERGEVTVWSVADGARLRDLAGQNQIVADLEVSPDGALLAAVATDTRITVWRLADGAPVATLENLGVPEIAFTPNGRSIAFITYPRELKLLDLRTGAVRSALRVEKELLDDVEFSPDGRLMALVETGGLKVYDASVLASPAASNGEAPKPLAVLEKPGRCIMQLAFSSGGDLLASTGCGGGEVRGHRPVLVWDVSRLGRR